MKQVISEMTSSWQLTALVLTRTTMYSELSGPKYTKVDDVIGQSLSLCTNVLYFWHIAAYQNEWNSKMIDVTNQGKISDFLPR